MLAVMSGCGDEDAFDRFGGGGGGGSGYVDMMFPGQAQIAQGPNVNPLTGEYCEEDVAKTRPVAIMLNNLKEALPQVGVSEAGMVYEVLAEGGITRLIGIYNDYDGIKEIGSIRSARDYCIDIADAHDAILVHAGQSESARKLIISRGTNNINGEFMYRSEERLKTMAYEHTLMMKGEDLAAGIKAKKYRATTEKAQPLAFYTYEMVPDGELATYIEIPYSVVKTDNPYAVSYFNFDTHKCVYKKGQFGADHVDGDDGFVLEFKNVVVIECAHSFADNEGHVNIGFTGTGKGKLFTMGKQVDITWKKESSTSSYTLYESDGETPIALNPGKTYIGVVPTGTDITIK